MVEVALISNNGGEAVSAYKTLMSSHLSRQRCITEFTKAYKEF